MSITVATLSMSEAAKYAGIPYTTFGVLLRSGEIPCIKVGKNLRGVRVRREAIDEWMARKEKESRAQALAG